MYAKLCFETSHASGRLPETSTEDFLKLKRDEKLGNGMLTSSSLPVHVATYPFVKAPIAAVL